VSQTITLTVNGQRQRVTTDGERPLLDVLREDLQLTGTKYGCGDGRCGACTVLIDGKKAHSCLTTAAEAAGKSITTIEGLSADGKLHPVQEAFLAEGAMQCGYCTAGMIMATVALLQAKPNPSDAEILEWVNGNLCRCNGYVKILRAVRRAAGKGDQP
jgi:aerobic-type carbon monoxide dehydrogenase small subunit (CoxS/CutS family)